MMPYTRAQRKRVYLDWRVIFSSSCNSDLRKAKAIRAVVQRHRPYYQDFEPDAVGILQSLLKDGVIQYSNDTRARELFPEVFETTQTRALPETVPRPVAAEGMAEAAQSSEAQKHLLCSLEQ